METENKKLGAGIITLCVLCIIGFAITVIASISVFALKDTIIAANANLMGTEAAAAAMPSVSETIISLVISLFTFISVILILLKKNIGIYGYFVMVILSIIASIIFNGFSIAIVISLIIPILMFIFYRKRKEIFS